VARQHIDTPLGHASLGHGRSSPATWIAVHDRLISRRLATLARRLAALARLSLHWPRQTATNRAAVLSATLSQLLWRTGPFADAATQPPSATAAFDPTRTFPPLRRATRGW
jgi:hypothetical protein